MKIVRFLRFDDAKRVLCGHSTFCVQNSQYYVRLGWETGDAHIGDSCENQVRFPDVRRNYELLCTTMISCWTKLNGEQLSGNDWKIFKDRMDGVAIVSNVETVAELLQELATNLLLPESDGRTTWHFEHGEVIYYGEAHPPEFDTMEAWRWKREIYRDQREYRFAFLAKSSMNKVENIVFHVREPASYIESIHFGPKLCRVQAKELVAGAIEAEVFAKIQNVDEIYKREPANSG